MKIITANILVPTEFEGSEIRAIAVLNNNGKEVQAQLDIKLLDVVEMNDPEPMPETEVEFCNECSVMHKLVGQKPDCQYCFRSHDKSS